MTKEEFFEECKKDRFLKAMYVFRDALGELQYAKAYLNADRSVAVRVQNAAREEVAYMTIYPHFHQRLFLDVVYTFTKFRGRKIASYMDKIAEHFLTENGYDGFLLRGAFHPTQMASDRQNNVYCAPEELDKRAGAFYRGRGYQIVDVEDFEAHPEQYPNLTMRDDFELGEGVTRSIVVKTVHKQKLPDSINFLSADRSDFASKSETFTK